MGINPILALQAALGAMTAVFVAGWWAAVNAVRRTPSLERSPATDAGLPTPVQAGIGAVTNFFDTLGIGSFATTTAIFRFLRVVPDRVIPGTLNVGHTIPTVVQAFIYTAVIPVDVLTLTSMIAAAVVGAWLGAGVVAKWPRRKVQVGMGAALLAAALFMLMKQLDLFPTGETAISQTIPAGVTEIALGNDLLIPVKIWEKAPGSREPFVEMKEVTAPPGTARTGEPSGWVWGDHKIRFVGAPGDREIRIDAAKIGVRSVRLAFAIAVNLLLGALMTLGIGLYAPCMILVGLLGMSEKTAFPIMMGSCAFLMPVGSFRFIREKSYSLRASVGLTIGGIPGVLLAAYIVKSMPLYAVRWLVIVVVIYAAVTMLKAGLTNEDAFAGSTARVEI